MRKVKRVVEAISTEYNPLPIKLLSNKYFAITILVLNLTDKPTPKRIEFFLPNSFLPTK